MNKFVKGILAFCTVFVSIFTFCLSPVYADESYPAYTVYANMDDSLTYMIMLNTGSDEWSAMIDSLNTVNPNPSFVAIYSGSIYAGSSSAEVYIDSSGNLHSSEDWFNFFNGSWRRVSNNYTLNGEAVTFISCDTLTSQIAYTNLNAVSWSIAQQYYKDGPGDDQLQEIIDLISDGNDESIGATSDILEKNESLDSAVTDWANIEDEYRSQASEGLSNIDLSGNPWNIADLATTGTWLSNQINRLYSNAGPAQIVFTFGLIVALAAVVIGRGGIR